MKFLLVPTFALLTTGLPILSAASPEGDVLMIAIDDLRPMLGCYGDPHILTPNIDRLAARSVVFERAYCQYAKCGPSRTSLLSGLRPAAVAVFSHNEADVRAFRKRRPDAVSLPAWFKRHGYHSRSFGKIHHDGWDEPGDWSAPSFPGREGEMMEIVDESQRGSPSIIAERFDCPVMQSPDVADEELFAGRMTQEVIRTLRSRADGESLFLAVGYRRPHLPFVAPKRYYDLYQPDTSWLAKNPLPPADSPVMAWFNSDGYVGSAKKHGLIMPGQPNREEGIAWNGYEMRSYVGVPNYGVIPEDLQLKLLQAYAACVSYVDAQIGKLLDELEKTGRLEKTTILLWSDHGWHLGEHSAWGKMTNFEVATRVPLMIAAPGIKPGRTRALAELVDLYPSLCDLRGVPKPDHLEGESLLPVLREPGASSLGTALSQYERFGGKNTGRALRTDRYRFVAWWEKRSGEIVARELYDHQSDPGETQNLAADPQHAAFVASLERELMSAFGLK
ncbi:MAG: sulfatase [Prosthecobacter sp.]